MEETIIAIPTFGEINIFYLKLKQIIMYRNKRSLGCVVYELITLQKFRIQKTFDSQEATTDSINRVVHSSEILKEMLQK